MNQSPSYFDDMLEVCMIDEYYKNLIFSGLPYIFLGLQVFVFYFVLRFLLEITGILWFMECILTPGQEVWEIPYIIVTIVSISFLGWISSTLLNQVDANMKKIHEEKMFYMERIAFLEKENEDMRKLFKKIKEVAEL
jgi:hypothetical protein